MKLAAVSSPKDRIEADLVVLPFWQQEKGVKFAGAERLLHDETASVLESGDFCGKQGETALVYTGKKDKRVLLLGLGKKEEASTETVRCAVAAAVRLCQGKRWERMSFVVPEGWHEAVAEGAVLANYLFDELKGKGSEKSRLPSLKEMCLIGVSKKGEAECKRAEVISRAVNFARDLVNGNADDVTPKRLVKVAQELAKGSRLLKTKILGKRELIREKLGLLLAVARASMHDPALILVEYRGKPSSKEWTAVVGKGVTYDTGGLNLKPTGSMETMKDDMSGAAAVLGTLKAVSALKLPVNIVGVIPATENAIGAHSYKPGDVYQSYSGKTVEISNTDAEGRLVLADAISYVQDHYKLKAVIDLATLTGGMVIALGELVAGLFSNDDKLSGALFKAGEKTCERLWRFPLYEGYKEVLKSKIADMKNSGDRKASSISGAVFIQEFIKDLPWAHLDIAGTAYLSNPKDYHQTPATGFGVQLLTEFFSAEKV